MQKLIEIVALSSITCVACGPVDIAELPTVQVSVVESNLEFRCPGVDAPVVVPGDRVRFSLDCLAVSCTLASLPGQSDCSDPALNPLAGSCFETLVSSVWDPSGTCAESTRAPGFDFSSGHALFERNDQLYFERYSEVIIVAEGRLPSPFESAYARYIFPLQD